MSEMGKILVTGGTGLVGYPLVKALVQEGYQVRVLWHPPTSPKVENFPGTERVRGDITNFQSCLEAAHGVEVVFHVAGNTSFWGKNKKIQRRVNLEGTRNIVRACLQQQVKRLIHTSSVAALGYPSRGTVGTEDMPLDPTSLKSNYSRTKYLAEQEVHRGIQKGLDGVIVNPGIIFGPPNGQFHAMDGFLKMAQSKVNFYPAGGLCACDIEDVVSGHMWAFRQGRKGERYILGGENLSYKTLFEIMNPVFGLPVPHREFSPKILYPLGYFLDGWSRITKTPPHLTPETARVLSYPLFYSSDKAIQDLGYRITPFTETIRRISKSYKIF